MNRFLNNLLLGLVFVLAASCAVNNESALSDGYQIKGAIEGASQVDVFLEQVKFAPDGRPSSVVFDTVSTDENGNFELTGNVIEPVLARVRIGKSSFAIPIPLDNQVYEITGTAPETETVKVNGDNDAQYMLEMISGMTDRNNEMREISSVMQMAQQSDPSKLDSLRQEFEAMRIELVDYLKEKINKTDNDVVAFYGNWLLPIDSETEFIKATASRFIPGSILARQTHARLSTYDNQQKLQAEKSMLGKIAPEIVSPGPDGKERKLSDLRGKVVLVDFWASWCGPCRRENPNVVRVYNEYRNKGFTVFSVSLDNDKNNWVKGIADDKLSWPDHVSDLNRFQTASARDYKVNGIPAAFLVDRSGTIVAENLRGAALEKKVSELLGS